MARLAPCPSCTRHFKVGSTSCPFCGGDVPTDVPMRGIPAGRPLTRAAMLFAGAAAVTACSSSSSPAPEKDSGVHEDSGGGQPLYGVFTDGGAVPHYGGIAHPDDGGAAQPDSGTGEHHEGGAVAAYGVMIPPEDAGTH